MTRTLTGVVEAGEPPMRQVIEASRRFRAAEDAGLSQRLRLFADSLYQAVIDFQLVRAGRPPSTIH